MRQIGLLAVLSVLATTLICNWPYHSSITVKHCVSFNHQWPHLLGVDIVAQEQLKVYLLLMMSNIWWIVDH